MTLKEKIIKGHEEQAVYYDSLAQTAKTREEEEFWYKRVLEHNEKARRIRNGEAQRHRIITIAAAAYNWFASKAGDTRMRPGIQPPKEGE